MKKLLALALVALLALVPFTGDALADKGKEKNKAGHSSERGAQPGNKDHNKPPKHVVVIATETENYNIDDNENENDNVDVGINDAVDSEEPAKVGVCHATGNGSFVFIQVSEHARGHLEHHADDIVDVAGPENCPDTVADAD